MATPFSTSNKQPSQQEIQPLLNLLNAGQLAATANMAQTLIAQYPNTFLLHNVLGIALDGLGEYDGAINSYRNALKLQPNMPDLHFNLGIVFGNLNRSWFSRALHQHRLTNDFAQAGARACTGLCPNSIFWRTALRN